MYLILKRYNYTQINDLASANMARPLVDLSLLKNNFDFSGTDTSNVGKFGIK